MSTPIENLIAFILQRRAELGLTQRQVAQAGDMNPGTLANIEMGRVTKAPSLGTLEKLARGLKVDVEQLIRIARGEAPVSEDGERPPSVDDWLRQIEGLAHAPTREERAILKAAEASGLFFKPLAEPGFWRAPPEDRRPAFRYLEGLLDEARRLDRLYRAPEASEQGI